MSPLARAAASSPLIILLLMAVLGCGIRHTEQAPAGPGRSADAQPPSEGESGAKAVMAEAEAGAKAALAAGIPEPATHHLAPKAAEVVHQISLSERGCIQFQPQWTTLRVGQSIAWHSDLKSPVTIYVSPGVFPRESYLVRPGATIRTGPARAPGRYAFWTAPAACRDMPRGVLLAGPGVRVRADFYASAPGGGEPIQPPHFGNRHW